MSLFTSDNVPVVGKKLQFEDMSDPIITVKGYMNYFGVAYSTAKGYYNRDKKHLGLQKWAKIQLSHFVRLYGSCVWQNGL